MLGQACYSQAAEERSAGRVPAETKECRRCHETKGKADFYHSKMTADGLQSYCKVWHALLRFPAIRPACGLCSTLSFNFWELRPIGLTTHPWVSQ